MSYGLGHSAPRRTKSKNIHTSATHHTPPRRSRRRRAGRLTGHVAGFWLLVAHTRPTTRPRFTRPSSSRSSRALASPHAPPTDSLARRPRHWGGRCTPRVLLARSLARSPLVACCSSLDRFAPSIQVVGIRRNSFSVISCFPLLRRWLAGWLASRPADKKPAGSGRWYFRKDGPSIFVAIHHA